MPWRTTRHPPEADARASVIAIRCPHCRARFARSGDRIPVYSVFACHACGARLMRQQSLVIALTPPPEATPNPIERTV
ncbi:MAG TPA: hypothetical protein VK837_13015 [Longimicrobiales bacterium]|nr:hypothetical protein [Longimicrobiales bacterium]